MQINRIHITDPSLLKIKKQDDYFAGLFSRLANTGGQIKIEGVPITKIGWFWKMCKVLFNLTDNFEDSKTPAQKFTETASDYDLPPEIANVFETVFVTIDDAVESGTMTDTLTNAIFEGHTGPDHDGENSTSLTDGGSFSADDFVSA